MTHVHEHDEEAEVPKHQHTANTSGSERSDWWYVDECICLQRDHGTSDTLESLVMGRHQHVLFALLCLFFAVEITNEKTFITTIFFIYFHLPHMTQVSRNHYNGSNYTCHVHHINTMMSRWKFSCEVSNLNVNMPRPTFPSCCILHSNLN